MQIAMRIDFARSQTTGPDARILALALASGIAGLSVMYPTVTVGNGAIGEWTDKLGAKPPRLTMPTISPDMSITTRFHDSSQAMTNAVMAGAAGLASLSNVLKPEITSLTDVAKAGLSGLAAPSATSKPDNESVTPAARFAPSQSPTRSIDHEATAETRLLKPKAAPVEGVPIGSVTPLDAVRIALPSATTELSLAGSMPPEATLGRVVNAVGGSPVPEPDSAPEMQPLATSPLPGAISVSVPGVLPRAQPVSLMSAPREVREFDLAKLASASPAAKNLARSSATALTEAAAKAAPRTTSLPTVPKVPDRIVGNHIIHIAGLSVEGVPSGNLSVRIGMNGDLSIKLADLLAPIRSQMAPDTFERLANSAAASEYVSFADLRAAGFDIRYDAGGDRLTVSAQP